MRNCELKTKSDTARLCRALEPLPCHRSILHLVRRGVCLELPVCYLVPNGMSSSDLSDALALSITVILLVYLLHESLIPVFVGNAIPIEASFPLEPGFLLFSNDVELVRREPAATAAGVAASREPGKPQTWACNCSTCASFEFISAFLNPKRIIDNFGQLASCQTLEHSRLIPHSVTKLSNPDKHVL